MKKLYCSEMDESTEREITESVFLVDGYNIADRLLEGVMFHVHFQDGEVLSVKVDEKHENYFSQFNQEMFLERVYRYAKRSIEGDEVDVPDYIKKKYNMTSDTQAYIR
jgi:hypothetical protein